MSYLAGKLSIQNHMWCIMCKVRVKCFRRELLKCCQFLLAASEVFGKYFTLNKHKQKPHVQHIPLKYVICSLSLVFQCRCIYCCPNKTVKAWPSRNICLCHRWRWKVVFFSRQLRKTYQDKSSKGSHAFFFSEYELFSIEDCQGLNRIEHSQAELNSLRK